MQTIKSVIDHDPLLRTLGRAVAARHIKSAKGATVLALQTPESVSYHGQTQKLSEAERQKHDQQVGMWLRDLGLWNLQI